MIGYAKITAKTAPQPQGPWSDETPIFGFEGATSVYAPVAMPSYDITGKTLAVKFSVSINGRLAQYVTTVVSLLIRIAVNEIFKIELMAYVHCSIGREQSVAEEADDKCSTRLLLCSIEAGISFTKYA